MSDENEVTVPEVEKIASLSGVLNQGGLNNEIKISPTFLRIARLIHTRKTDKDGENLPIFLDIELDKEYIINKNDGSFPFFKINITKEDLDNGVMILSESRHNFQIAFFHEGELSMAKQSESVIEGIARNFFCLTSKKDHNYMIAEEICFNYYEYILPGDHLFCVCLNSGYCSLFCSKAQPRYEKCAERIKIERNLYQVMQEKINLLEDELKEVKKKKDGIKDKTEKLTPNTEEFISKRVNLYNDLFPKSEENHGYCSNLNIFRF